jgi:polyisoprenoid-binding protein YceI
VRRRLRWLVVAAIVVVLAAGGAVAWYVFGEDAPAKPELSDNTRDGAAGQPGDPNGTWDIAPGADVYVGYRIKELFGGATIKRDAVGRTPKTTGTMTIADGVVTAADVRADVTALDSKRAARDSYLRDNALETNEFPVATFALTEPVELPANVRTGDALDLEVAGDLTLHGQTKPVSLTVQARWDGGTIEVVGTAPVVLSEFGIDAPDTAVARVDDEGSLELRLVFARA